MDFLDNGVDTKEIILFFDNNSKFNLLDAAKELSNRIPDLGDATIINEQKTIAGIPLLFFRNNKDIILSINTHSISLCLHEKYFNDIEIMIFDIADAFNDLNVKLIRMGYISNIFLDNNKIERVKNTFLKNDKISDILDFNIGWHRKIDIKFGNINCWERFITEKTDIDNLVAQYDFNTPVDIVFDFELKSIKEFFKVSNKYIEDRIKLI